MPPEGGGAGAPHYALRPGTRLSEFEIVSTIGEGGFGIVYLAWDGSLQRQVALKEYMPSSLAGRVGVQVSVLSERHRDTFDLGLRSFVNEAQMLARFDHPSLVKVHRFWIANGTAYMAMPFYKGSTLKALLKQSSAPPTQQWLLFLLDSLTSALAVLHRDRVYHRDIAPDNILLLEGSDALSPSPLLLDFGAARRVIAEATHAPTVILKSGYAPLEQYGEGTDATPQGPWTDIYALGATIHHAIRGVTPQAAVHRVVSDRYKPLALTPQPGFDASFLAAIDKALSIHAAERPQSMAEFRGLLGLGDRHVGVAPQPKTEPSGGFVPSTPTSPPPLQLGKDESVGAGRVGKWAGTGLVAVLIGGAAWVVFRPVDKPNVEPPGVVASAPLTSPSQPGRARVAIEPPPLSGMSPDPAQDAHAPASTVVAPFQEEPRRDRRRSPQPAASGASQVTKPPVPVREPVTAATKAECERLLVRMSTGGESMQDLMERYKTLDCR